MRYRELGSTLVASLLLAGCGQGRTQSQPAKTATPQEATLATIGEMAPPIEVTTLQGETFDLAGLRGKVVAINFFATWCGPCRAEIPHLEQEVWARFRDQEFAMIGIGRGHTNAELAPFVRETGITYPVAGDPKRGAFGLYATQYIPRNFVIDREGAIAYESSGYSQEELGRMISAIEHSLVH